jgi:hypothetical protein
MIQPFEMSVTQCMTLVELKNELNHIFGLANESLRKVSKIYYGESFISLASHKHFDYYYEYKLLKNDVDVQEMFSYEENAEGPFNLDVKSQ